jgi:fermentation-respiration switch protein FrsA (DUF1100 family)
MGACKKFPSKECRRNFVLSFPYTQLDSLVELEGSPRAPLRLKENIGRAENRDEAPFHSASKIPMQLISGGNTLVTPNRHCEKNFSEALVELAKFVLFGQFDDEASHF